MSFQPLLQEVGVSGVFLVALWWLSVAAVVAWLAHQKGQSPLGFFLIAGVLSPMVGLLAIIAARDLKEAAENEVANETFRQMMAPVLLQIDGIRGHIAVSNDTARPKLPPNLPVTPPAPQPAVSTTPRTAAAAGS